MGSARWKRFWRLLAWLIVIVVTCGFVAEWYLYRQGFRVEDLSQLRVQLEFDPYLGWCVSPRAPRHCQTLVGEVVEHAGVSSSAAGSSVISTVSAFTT